MSSTATAGLDQAALDNLTPEEREAFNDSEYSADQRATLERLASGAKDDDLDDDGDPNEVLDADGKPVVVDTAAADAKPAPAAAAPAQAAAGAADVTDVAVKPAAQTPVTYQASLPENFDAQVAEIAEKTTALRAQFKAGDIDFDTFEEQKAVLDASRESLTVARTKAEVSQEMTQQTAAQAWAQAIDNLYTSAMKEGVDYKTDKVRLEDLDTFVKALANKPENSDKSMEWFMSEAHKRVNALHGTPAPAAAAGGAPAPKPAPAAQNRTPPAAPKNLAAVPGGDGPGDVGSEFAHLDALDGNDLEAAIARMTPAQREKYSKGG